VRKRGYWKKRGRELVKPPYLNQGVSFSHARRRNLWRKGESLFYPGGASLIKKKGYATDISKLRRIGKLPIPIEKVKSRFGKGRGNPSLTSFREGLVEQKNPGQMTVVPPA